MVDNSSVFNSIPDPTARQVAVNVLFLSTPHSVVCRISESISYRTVPNDGKSY
jgi:hypothetical protein